jgi:hypothetical protein
VATGLVYNPNGDAQREGEGKKLGSLSKKKVDKKPETLAKNEVV